METTSKDEIREVEAMIARDSDDTLDKKLQRLHREKLMPTCLLNQMNREKVDLLISLIIKEKDRRKTSE